VLGERRGEGRVGRVLDYTRVAPRAAARCPHFGACGGCALQHLTDESYAAAKIEWLAASLRQHGLDPHVLRPLRRLHPGTRRRARFALARGKDGAPHVGFHARASPRVVDMTNCAVLHPAITTLVPRLRALLPAILALDKAASATATLADTGIDLLLDLPAPPGLASLEAMAAFARQSALARLAWRRAGGQPMPVALLHPVRIAFAGVAVDLPYDAFLQASAETDAVLTEAACEGAAGARRIAELYAGVGTFTFALAKLAPVHAVEGDAAALAALRAAAERTRLPITAERRDLERRPLAAAELAPFDTVVFDPPRAGAKSQSEALAQSAVRRIVALSCNPATFARDARALVAGGFRLVAVEAFDPFVWSTHLELVARFER
ncbi:MAG: class I SAM-dependent RNA methyltransferase, partial [Stellaceae bacterium]